jgi:hypothetical protein
MTARQTEEQPISAFRTKTKGDCTDCVSRLGRLPGSSLLNFCHGYCASVEIESHRGWEGILVLKSTVQRDCRRFCFTFDGQFSTH